MSLLFKSNGSFTVDRMILPEEAKEIAALLVHPDATVTVQSLTLDLAKGETTVSFNALHRIEQH